MDALSYTASSMVGVVPCGYPIDATDAIGAVGAPYAYPMSAPLVFAALDHCVIVHMFILTPLSIGRRIHGNHPERSEKHPNSPTGRLLAVWPSPITTYPFRLH